MSDSALPPILRLRGLAKAFGRTHALSGVDFDLRPGEIHALLGENGAGKSTLIKILGGIHTPDSGVIEIDGRSTDINGVRTAERLGIRLIHQEQALAPNLTVAENIFLNREILKRGLLDRSAMVEKTRELCEQLGFPEIAEVETPVGALSLAHRQLVEFARALAVQARVLILDEPTASLSAAETGRLFAVLRILRRQGVGIIYISHHLHEIRELADRVTVLRDGRSVGTRPLAEISSATLLRWMVGRELREHTLRPPKNFGKVMLETQELRGVGVSAVSFQVRSGEVLGFAGLVGAGRTELARTLFGITPAIGGVIRVDGRSVSIRCPADALAAGIVLAPEERKREGLVMSKSVGFNLALPWTREWIRRGWPDRSRRAVIVQSAISRLTIKVTSSDQTVSELSGGNQQKVVVGRWLEHPPKVLILDEPTRGVDVGAREEMFRLVTRWVGEGMAVILISSDLAELMSLSHRLVLYRGGRIVREADAAAIGAEEIMAELTRN